jgi:DNA modification methylase
VITSAPTVNAIHHGDCLELLRSLEADSIDLAFADPPFNIGFKYDEYHDSHEDETYVGWCTDWMRQLHRVLKPTGSFWLAIGDEFAADLRVVAHRELGFEPRNWIVWYYTFGQNCKAKFNRSHVHIFHFVKDQEHHTFNYEDPLVRVPSARALVYGDRRANPTGRLPDDTWILRPQDLRDDPVAFQPMDDTWFYSRVAGTFKERQGFHGCQMPEQLLGRIIRISSNPGDVVLDPFSGSGTTLAVAKKLSRHYLGFDLSTDYVKYATERLEDAWPGQKLSGPEDPVASSPTTAAGRKLKGHPLLPVFKEEDFLPVEQPADEIEALEPVDAIPSPPVAPPVALTVAAPPASLHELQRAALVSAFSAAHQGYSVNWLLCNSALQQDFHDACRREGLFGSPRDWNHELVRIVQHDRVLKARAKKKPNFTAVELDIVTSAAEIAWQSVMENHHQRPLAEMFCDPELGAEFDSLAAKYVKGAEAARIRWAAVQLHKSLAGWQSEAKRYHYVFKTRDFRQFQPWGRCKFAKWNAMAGLYLLRAKDKTPLYIGETLDLGARLATHSAAKQPGAKIAQVAVILADELPSGDYRQPLWVDLVRRYAPGLNLPQSLGKE